MALINLIITSLTALFNSFLSISPFVFHGLVPWIDTLSTPPFVPASPKANFTPTFWEVIPTADVCIVDLLSPPPALTFPFCVDAEDDQQSFSVPSHKEPTAKELLWELWQMLKQALLCFTVNMNDFVRRNPYIQTKKSYCRLRRVYEPVSRHSRSRLWDRSLPSSPVQLQFTVRRRAVSCSPALPSVPAPSHTAAPLSPTSPPLSPPTYLPISTYLSASELSDTRVATLEATVSAED